MVWPSKSINFQQIFNRNLVNRSERKKKENTILNVCPFLGADPEAELVRHYLIERTPNGNVRLKGCPNEPDFCEFCRLNFVSRTILIWFRFSQ